MSIIIPSDTGKKKQERETVGAISTQLKEKADYSYDAIELQREMQKDYEANIIECVENGKKDFDDDFFVVVTTKKERLMDNVLRNYFLARNSCPSPTWDQVVYRYHRKNDHIEFLWVIPSQDTCELFKDNILSIAPEERPLLQYILDFEDKTLLRLSRTLNGEDIESDWCSTIILHK